MLKSYLTDHQIAELVREANAICTQYDFARLKAITKKYGVSQISHLLKKADTQDEQIFLSDPKWTNLQSFCKRISCPPNTFIENGGDYFGFISKLGKKYADPDAIKQGVEIKQFVDYIFQGKSVGQKLDIANAIKVCITKQVSYDEFHNLIFKDNGKI